MNTQLIDFPKIYQNQPEPTGDEWLAKFATMKSKIESGGIVGFFGKRGTGKTRMAYELAKSCQLPDSHIIGINRRDERPIIYRTAMAMFMELRSTYCKNAEASEIEIFDWYRDAALMVIDEMQERGETAFEDRKLTAIIDARYQNGRPTILIGNYTKAEWASCVSPSIVSRMIETGGTADFSWDSYRNRQSK
jgi:DNA replication protein DnaC